MKTTCENKECFFLKAVPVITVICLAVFVLVYTGYFNLDRKVDNITNILISHKTGEKIA